MAEKELCLVTGGSGFVGYHIVMALLERGYRVRVLDNLHRNCNNVASLAKEGKVEFINGDIRYWDSVNEAMEGVGYVFHEAAICLNRSKAFPMEAVDVNLNGSLNVFQAAINHGVKKMIYASTSSVYGQPDYLPIDEKHPKNCITPYESSKLCAEHMLKFMARDSDMKWVALRYFNVYGNKQSTDAYYTSVINVFIKKVLAGEPPTIAGKGDQSMDFTHVSDVVAANLAAMDSDVTEEAFNVARGKEVSIKEIAQNILDLLNSKIEPTFIDREVLVTKRRADVSKLKELLGVTPKVDIVDGLKMLVEDVKAHPEDY